MLLRFLPALVAAANGIAVAIGFVLGRVDQYPIRLLAVQIFIVLVALLMASNKLSLRRAGLILTIVGIVCTFSGMVLYIPTIAVAVWRGTSTSQ
jgi:hypothetical protein